VASPIYLGNTPMCEHGLGSNGGNPFGPWAGTFGAGQRVSLFQFPLTIKNPAGGHIYGRVAFSSYTNTPGSVIQGSSVVDSGAQSVWARYYFNNITGAAMWEQFAYTFWMGPYAAGAHNLDLGVYIAAGTLTFDANGGGTALAYEIP
jgi:hypothetical protein